MGLPSQQCRIAGHVVSLTGATWTTTLPLTHSEPALPQVRDGSVVPVTLVEKSVVIVVASAVESVAIAVVDRTLLESRDIAIDGTVVARSISEGQRRADVVDNDERRWWWKD